VTNNAYRAVLLLPPLLVGLAGLGAHNGLLMLAGVGGIVVWCMWTGGW
jgi:hypothetical protein